MTIPVGAARAQVPVPAGTPMAGYAARTGPSTGEQDPVTVRALVLDGVALLTVDVCALHERTIAQVHDGVAGLVRECVVTATHTHSGPCVAFGRLGPHALDVHEALVGAAVRAVRAAVGDVRECVVAYGSAPGVRIARNRRHPDRSSDPPVQFLRFDDGAATRAWLVTYPCHPVVLGAENRRVSGDYPAALRDLLERTAPGSVAVFATGAAGDQNPGAFSPEDSFAASAGRTFADVRQVGGVLAEAVLGADLAPVAGSGVRVASAKVDLPFDRVSPAQAEAELSAWRAELAAETTAERRALLGAWSAWAEDLLAGRLDHLGQSWAGRVTSIGLGEVTIVALPGEPFLATADRIAEAGVVTRGGPVLVLGYADGCPGYLLPREDYAHGGYEVLEAHRYYAMPGPFAAGCAEQVEAAAGRAMVQVTEE